MDLKENLLIGLGILGIGLVSMDFFKEGNRRKKERDKEKENSPTSYHYAKQYACRSVACTGYTAFDGWR